MSDADLKTYPHLKPLADRVDAASKAFDKMEAAVAGVRKDLAAHRANDADRALKALFDIEHMTQFSANALAARTLDDLLKQVQPALDAAARTLSDARQALAEAVKDAPQYEGRKRREAAAADPASPVNTYAARDRVPARRRRAARCCRGRWWRARSAPLLAPDFHGYRDGTNAAAFEAAVTACLPRLEAADERQPGGPGDHRAGLRGHRPGAGKAGRRTVNCPEPCRGAKRREAANDYRAGRMPENRGKTMTTTQRFFETIAKHAVRHPDLEADADKLRALGAEHVGRARADIMVIDEKFRRHGTALPTGGSTRSGYALGMSGSTGSSSSMQGWLDFSFISTRACAPASAFEPQWSCGGSWIPTRRSTTGRMPQSPTAVWRRGSTISGFRRSQT